MVQTSGVQFVIQLMMVTAKLDVVSARVGYLALIFAGILLITLISMGGRGECVGGLKDRVQGWFSRWELCGERFLRCTHTDRRIFMTSTRLIFAADRIYCSLHVLLVL